MEGSLTSMFQKTLRVVTRGEGDIVDVTPLVREAVLESGCMSGLVHVFVTGSTAAVTTIEYEPGVLEDLKRSLSLMAPSGVPYRHDTRWGDGNGRSHVKAALVGPSLAIPIIGGNLLTGTWQQVVLLELDTREARDRSLIVTVF